jgi:class 3 adenylate cyclase/tetratricopeptide (TPR) repeat protein
MFCDLVGSTALSERLDPEELREVVRAYQQACAQVINRYEGHIAQYLGDGLLVYFGYPLAHEDDAARAVRAGLEIITAVQKQVPSPLVREPLLSPSPFQGEGRGEGDRQARVHLHYSPHPSPLPTGERGLLSLHVRVGIHTGQVVIGEIGGGNKRENLALGETPNIAARVQGVAEPDSMVLSAATYRLVTDLFECQDLGPQTLKGVSTPLTLYRVVRESEIQSRFEATLRKGLAPLVGREEELGLLRRRWEQAKAGEGQVVLLSGEPGIGKSRLVEALKNHVRQEGATLIEFRCSPYYQNSAWYPIIEHLQRLLHFERDDAPEEKLKKLEDARVGATGRSPLQPDTIPLLAALLSLPHPDDYPALTLSPQKQKQKTQEALVTWLMEKAERQTVYCVWEDVHWADPSTLEVLTLLLDQTPATRLLALLTFRPEFIPPWRPRSHIAQLTLNRLGRQQVEAMVEGVTGGKALPVDLLQQIVSKTDGVPLFVEELTKVVLESVGTTGRSPLQTIPATLQDSLMARLDRLGPAKEVAQLGATLGREFSYELLQAVSPFDEETLQQRLRQLVEAELFYQRGLPPHATYIFKHALIQDTAYQSLLKSARQQYHHQIAQALEEQFSETKETQPELLAYHYTEATLKEQAIPYWQQAGEKAIERSAYTEAISHFTRGREMLEALPDTPDLPLKRLSLQFLLGNVLMATKGYAAPEVEQTLAKARELCRQVGENPLLFRVLPQLRGFHFVRGELDMARELAEQQLAFAQRVQFPPLLVWAYYGLGETLLFSGELVSARVQLEQGITYYDPQQIRAFSVPTVHDPKVACLTHLARVLWYLGYPDQALKKMQEAVALARELSHSFSLAWALSNTAFHHQLRRERQPAQEWAEAAIIFASEQGFPFWVARGEVTQGWALAEQGQEEQGISLIHQGLAAWQSTGTELWRSALYAALAEAYGKVEQSVEGLTMLADAFAAMGKSRAFMEEAELYRLKGELTLQQFKVQGSMFKVEESLESAVRSPESEAEECFFKAVEISRKQQAKSLELRATMSLARLRQQQASEQRAKSREQGAGNRKQGACVRLDEAREMLSNIYNWFTEGFDTRDLQEAKALIEELSH